MKIVHLRRHEDNRGWLTENTLEKIMEESRHFFVSCSKPGIVRGNHYHKHKSEWFYVIKGACQIIIEDVETKKRQKKIIKDTDLSIIQVLPNQAHAFKNVGDGEMYLLALVNEVLDHHNPDTYDYKLI